MKKYKYFTFLFLIIVFGIGFNVSNTRAEVALKYPISELENCRDKNACKQYCVISSHYLACTNFGEKNKLISKDDAARAKKLVDVLKNAGPGGCRGEAVCKDYCNKTGNQKECFVFSTKNGLISSERLKEIESGIDKLRSVLKQIPSEMRSCVVEKAGIGIINKIENGKGEAIDLVEVGGTFQNCAMVFGGALQQKSDDGSKEQMTTMQNCVKSMLSGNGAKIKSGSSIQEIIFQNCLPKGIKIPPGAGAGMNREFLKKLEQSYGTNLSPKDLDSLKKAREQLESQAQPEVAGSGSGMGL